MSTLVETAEVDQALDASGKTKLIVCCENKDVTGARRLLDSNASPDIANRDGQTPLYVSCKAGCAELVQMLLFHRASLGRTNSNGYSPLYIASQSGHLDVCSALIDAKADVNQGAKNRATPVFIASEVGHARIVTVLLRARANVDTQKNDDSTALIAASYFGRADIVSLLIDANAKLDVRDSDGTALDNARKQKHSSVVELLKQAEAARAALAAHGLLDSDVEDDCEAGHDADGDHQPDEVEEDHFEADVDEEDDVLDEVHESMQHVPSPTRPLPSELGLATPGAGERPKSAKALRKPPQNAPSNATTARLQHKGGGAASKGVRALPTAADPESAAAVAAAVTAAGEQRRSQQQQQQQEAAEARRRQGSAKQQHEAAEAQRRQEVAERERREASASSSASARTKPQLNPEKRASARAAEWAAAEAEAAERLRRLEQRTGVVESDDPDESDDEELDLDALRRQAKERLTSQEGRSSYATRKGESVGVSKLETRLKGAQREFHPPVGATQWVDEQDEAAPAGADEYVDE